jgi:ATP-dependent RNA helicase SUPV3L1/SUV3
MLAWEGYERLVAQLGEDAVGLMTGEERINEGAPVTCRTVEMAPMACTTLVLDEVQWAADTERGWAWTRLLAGCDCDELVVTGEVGALPLVRAVLGDEVEVEFTERLTPLHAARKPLGVGDVANRSVVVAFSRKAVRHVAGLFSEAGRSVSVLYGALPPEVRRLQMARFISGEAEICVATDVIGHGVNLPCDAVYFSETNKFDGVSRRELAPWEVAQIGGRAGRYGFSEQGEVGVLSGLPGFEANASLVSRAGEARTEVEGHPAYRVVTKGLVAPALEDLGAKHAKDLPKAIETWTKAAREQLIGVSWAEVANLAPITDRLVVLRRTKADGKSVLSQLDLDDAWRLGRAPCDADDEADAWVLSSLGRTLIGGSTAWAERVISRPVGRNADSGFLEALSRTLVVMQWATLALAGRLGAVTHGAVVAKLDEVVAVLNDRLDREVRDGVVHCDTCGTVCAPWFSQCDACHRTGRSWGGGWDDDEYEDDEYDHPVSSAPRKSAEQRERRRSFDALIRQAAVADPLLARPAGASRETWAQTVIPQLQAADGLHRAELRERLAASLLGSSNG